MAMQQGRLRERSQPALGTHPEEGSSLVIDLLCCHLVATCKFELEPESPQARCLFNCLTTQLTNPARS